MSVKAIESIYIAGKMQEMNWRYELFDAYEAPAEDHKHQLGYNPLTVGDDSVWPESSRVTVCGLRYTGPFFVDIYGGHGWGYTPQDNHGSNVSNAYKYFSYEEEERERIGQARKKTQEQCFYAIANADLIFAWIDSIDCYGTIAEIGYAKAMGKAIWITSPKRYDDLWFVYQMAQQIMYINPDDPNISLKGALRYFLNYHQKRHLKMDSPIEQAFWEAWIDITSPYKAFELVPQHPIGKYRVDFAHIPTQTAIELDGHATHSSPDAIAYDRKRHREIEEQGWHIIRFGGKEIYSDARKCAEETLRLLMERLNKVKGVSHESA